MPETGWTKVDTMVRDIAARAAQAKSEHDCQSVGHLCRECIITLANAVYDATRHPTLDGVPASATDAKRKLEAFVAVELRSSHGKHIREIVRAAFDLANAVQHRQGATPGDAALAAETTTSLIRVISIIAGRLHETQVVRLHSDVGDLVRLREHGVQLLNRRVRNDDELTALRADLRAWEAETLAELEKCATRSEVSAFRVLGSLTAVGFSGVYNDVHNHEKMMLNVRLSRLLAIISRIEGVVR